MDSNFENIHKILAGLNPHIMGYLANTSGDEIQQVKLFNDDGTFNNELLTKEGFLNSIFTDSNEKLKDMYGNLYDAIANMDGDSTMSIEDLKFFASLGKNQSPKDSIDKEDFFALGVAGRNINQYIKPNTGIKEEAAELNIVSQNQVEMPSAVSEVNENLGINGKIDEPVLQGSVGDCWLLAGINSLNATDEGKKIIRNSIIPNVNGTITINFAGVGEQITLTPDEIKQNDTDLNLRDNYSNGDNDALALEIAMQKLIEKNPTLFMGLDKGINGGQPFNLWKALVPNHNITYFSCSSENSDTISSDNKSVSSDSGPSSNFANKVEQILNRAVDNKNIAMGFSTGGHAMAITDVQGNSVTYIDSMTYATTTLTREKFINSITEFSYIDLSK